MTQQSWLIKPEEAGTRLDKWLADGTRLGSRAKAFDAITRGKIFVNDSEQTALEAGRKLATGDKVMFWEDRPGSAKQRIFKDRKVADLHILHEDDTLLVINKPAGLLTVRLATQPDEETLHEQVSDYLRPRNKIKPFVIHRLDRDTSGLVIFAKTQAARENLKRQFIAQSPERIYHALVYGIPFPSKGIWRDWLVWDESELVQKLGHVRDQRSVEAKCHYQVLEEFAEASLLEVKLITGKQNQIRVQATVHGHQLIGERQYLATPPRHSINFVRQALHAFRLGFRHPLNNRPLKLEAPVPDDLAALLKSLGLKIK